MSCNDLRILVVRYPPGLVQPVPLTPTPLISSQTSTACLVACDTQIMNCQNACVIVGPTIGAANPAGNAPCFMFAGDRRRGGANERQGSAVRGRRQPIDAHPATRDDQAPSAQAVDLRAQRRRLWGGDPQIARRRRRRQRRDLRPHRPRRDRYVRTDGAFLFWTTPQGPHADWTSSAKGAQSIVCDRRCPRHRARTRAVVGREPWSVAPQLPPGLFSLCAGTKECRNLGPHGWPWRRVGVSSVGRFRCDAVSTSCEGCCSITE
jgi:hypothetical protein